MNLAYGASRAFWGPPDAILSTNITDSANTTRTGLLLCRNYTLNSGITVTPTVGTDTGILTIIAKHTIRINGAINFSGINDPASLVSGPGGSVFGEPGGDGNTVGVGGIGGSVFQSGVGLGHFIHPSVIRIGAIGGRGNICGGGGGGALKPGGNGALTSATAPGTQALGGFGGGAIVLMAPTIIIGEDALFNVAGASPAGAVFYGAQAAGGGGAGGTIALIAQRLFESEGAAFSVNGGDGGSGITGAGGSGGTENQPGGAGPPGLGGGGGGGAGGHIIRRIVW